MTPLGTGALAKIMEVLSGSARGAARVSVAIARINNANGKIMVDLRCVVKIEVLLYLSGDV
jgi:hypothetical protein